MKADQFNKKFPVGADVLYKNDFGDKKATKTRSEAWELGSGDAVVLLEGATGGFSVERITSANEIILDNTPVKALELKNE